MSETETTENVQPSDRAEKKKRSLEDMDFEASMRELGATLARDAHLRKCLLMGLLIAGGLYLISE